MDSGPNGRPGRLGGRDGRMARSSSNMSGEPLGSFGMAGSQATRGGRKGLDGGCGSSAASRGSPWATRAEPSQVICSKTEVGRKATTEQQGEEWRGSVPKPSSGAEVCATALAMPVSDSTATGWCNAITSATIAMRAGSTRRPNSNTSSPRDGTKPYQRIILIVRLNPAILGKSTSVLLSALHRSRPGESAGAPENDPHSLAEDGTANNA